MKTLSRVLIALIIIIIGVFFLLGKIFYPSRYLDIAQKNTEKYSVSPHLVMAVIKAESGFDPQATSHKDARGLMQIMPETAQWCADMMEIENFEIDSLYEPEVNIKIGTWYLNYLIDLYDGRVDVALAAYNAGLGNVTKWLSDEKYSSDGKGLDNIPFTETDRYVQNVLKYYEKYEELY